MSAVVGGLRRSRRKKVVDNSTWSIDDALKRPRLKASHEKHVHFQAEQLTEVIGVAESSFSRTPWPVNLFNCDICSTRITAGLRGFDNYYTCESCANFDVCLQCWTKGPKSRMKHDGCSNCDLTLIDINSELRDAMTEAMTDE